MGKRDALLDILKGIGIILVVLGHILQNGIGSIIYLFHMPFFFFLSGAGLGYSKKQNVIGVKGYLRSLMVPYFVFSLFSFLYWYFIENRFRPTNITPLFRGFVGTWDVKDQEFCNIFTAYSAEKAFEYNIVLWFLPCLFCTLILYKTIKCYLPQYTSMIVILFSIVGFVLHTRIPLLIWCADLALVALAFVWLGDITYKKIKNVHPIVLGGSVLLSIYIIASYNPSVDMRLHHFPEWWQFYIVAITMTVLIIRIAPFLLPYECGVLKWIGKNSLVIMCMHEPIKRIVLKIVSILLGCNLEVVRSSVLLSFGVTLLVIAIIYPIAKVINQYAPMLIGRK